MASTDTVINSIIEQNRQFATDFVKDAQSNSNDALNYADINSPTYNVSSVNYKNLNINKPVLNVDSFESDFYNFLNPLKEDFKDKFDEFLNKYFSDILSFKDDEEYLKDIIKNGYKINNNDNIINKAKDKTYKEYINLNEDIIKSFDSKGFKLPNGLLIEQLSRNKEQYNNNISNIIRDVMIKEIDINVDLIKFSITNILNQKNNAINNTLNYIKSYILLNDNTQQFIESKTNNYVKLNNVLNDYYKNILIDLDNQIKIDLANMNKNVNIKTSENEYFIKAAQMKTNAALSVAEVLRGIGQSAISANNAVLQLADSTTRTS